MSLMEAYSRKRDLYPGNRDLLTLVYLLELSIGLFEKRSISFNLKRPTDLEKRATNSCLSIKRPRASSSDVPRELTEERTHIMTHL